MPFTCEDAVAFIAESVNVGYATISPEFKFISINLAYCKMLNTVPELVIGKTFVEFTHPEDAAIDVALATQLKNGEATDYAFAKRHIQRGSTPLKTGSVGLGAGW